MRQETINIYKFEELSDEAKEKAIEKFRYSNQEYAWSAEWRDSLNAFADKFGVYIKNWACNAYETPYFRFSFKNDDERENMAGVRLWKYLQNNHADIIAKWDECPLTGYCGDYSALYELAQFVKKPDKRDFNQLITDSLHTFFKDWQNDMEYQDSDEYISEHIIANEYEFTENGSIY